MSDELRDPEIVRTPADKTVSGIPSNRMLRENRDRGLRRPLLWGVVQVRDTEAPDLYGRFPVGFLEWAYRVLELGGSTSILHVCSGGLEAGTRGVRVDIRPQVRPDVVADGRELPFADSSFDAVLLDPPWSVEYARGLYGVEYPRPSALLAEAARVVRPGRRVGFMHFLVPKPAPGLAFVEAHGIITGLGYRMRALTVYRKEPRGLFHEPCRMHLGEQVTP